MNRFLQSSKNKEKGADFAYALAKYLNKLLFTANFRK